MRSIPHCKQCFLLLSLPSLCCRLHCATFISIQWRVYGFLYTTSRWIFSFLSQYLRTFYHLRWMLLFIISIEFAKLNITRSFHIKIKWICIIKSCVSPSHSFHLLFTLSPAISGYCLLVAYLHFYRVPTNREKEKKTVTIPKRYCDFHLHCAYHSSCAFFCWVCFLCVCQWNPIFDR